MSNGEISSTGSNGVDTLVRLLSGDSTSQRIRRVITAYVVGATVWEIAKKAKSTFTAKTAYTISVTARDEIYPEVCAKVLEMISTKNRRATVASSIYNNGRPLKNATPVEVFDDDDEEMPSIRSLRLGLDGGSSQTVIIGGHRVKVEVVDANTGSSGGASDDDRMMEFILAKQKVTFTATGATAREAVVKFLEEIADLKLGEERLPKFYIARAWGSWESRRDLPLRTMETVVLREGQAEAILNDLTEFFDNERFYNSIGIPYHRGYLLYGQPGTGKTSIAKALANHFGMDVYYMSLGDMRNDTNLLSLISQVTPRSMLLLEDIDTAHSATERTDTVDKASVSGLLNALDGIATPHGLVTVMTTNHIEELDSALTRPGRVDRQEEITYLANEQFGRLWTMFYGTDDAPQLHAPEVTPAEVVEVFKRHIEDPEGARLELQFEDVAT